jgi:hypothetical protein
MDKDARGFFVGRFSDERETRSRGYLGGRGCTFADVSLKPQAVLPNIPCFTLLGAESRRPQSTAVDRPLHFILWRPIAGSVHAEEKIRKNRRLIALTGVAGCRGATGGRDY